MRAQSARSQVVRKGAEIYVGRLRRQLEPAQDGNFVAIDAETGDFEVAPEALEASRLLKLRHPESIPYLRRIGQRVSFRLGLGRSAGAGA